MIEQHTALLLCDRALSQNTLNERTTYADDLDNQDTACPPMDTPDSSQAASVPLPPSPPPHDDPVPSISAQLSLRDPGNENRARSTDGERASSATEHEDSPPAPPPHEDTNPTSISHAPTFPQNGTAEPPSAPAEEPAGRLPQPSVGHGEETDFNVPPPTPPAKPVPSNPVSPAARRPPAPLPNLPSSPRTTNGHIRQSVDSRPSTPNGRAASRPSTDSSHKRSLTLSKGNTVSVVFISSALETIAASKEAKRSAPLRDSAKVALDMVKSGQGGDRPRDIFEPLRLACETRSEKLMIASLDCISKLISYSFFADTSSSTHAPPSPPPSPGPNARSMSGSHTSLPAPSLVDIVVHTITSCHTESTPETVSLQIVKALLALVLSPTVLVHQSSLLKAVRTVYNVFLLSVDPVNQMVAQGGLTQMVNHVFARCRIPSTNFPPSESSATLSGHSESGRSSKRPSVISSPRSSLPLPPQTPSASGSEETGIALVRAPSEPSSSAASVAASEAATEADEETAANGQANGSYQVLYVLGSRSVSVLP